MIKIKHPYIIQAFSVALLAFSIVFAGSSNNYVSAAAPGCYRISGGEPQRLNACPTENAIYDDGRGANIAPPGPNTNSCFVYSQNLYDGDESWGDPYVQVSCDALNPCPDGSELRYSDDELGPPSCVDENTETSGEFAGGATPSSSGVDFKVSFNGEATLENENYCGKGSQQVRISFDIGCLGESYDGEALNPVLDMLFALLRFVSAGVGLIVIGSIIWAGIQYSTSRGNPQSTEASIKRVTNAVIALLIYIFSFAILNFLVPGGLFVG